MTTEDYDTLSPFNWPQSASGHRETTRFFADGKFYHTDGKARFMSTALPQTSRVNADYPLTLNTGRIRDQWHTMTRTGKSARLSSISRSPLPNCIHVMPAICASNALISWKFESPLGKIIVRALVTERQARGNIFVPMHWNDQFAANARVDRLVPPLTDPFSGQPASKKSP